MQERASNVPAGTAPAGPPGPAGAGRTWHGWQLHVASPDPEALESAVVEALPPVLRMAGRLPGVPPVPRPWYFTRAWAPRPHLRVCVAGLDDRQAAEVEAVLTERLAAVNRLLPAADPAGTAGFAPGVRRLPAASAVPGAPGADRGAYGEADGSGYGGAARADAHGSGSPAGADRERELLHASSAVCLRACAARTDHRNDAFTDGLELLAAALAVRPDPAALLRAHHAAGEPAQDRQAAEPGATADADRLLAAGPGLRALAAGAPSRWSALVRRLAEAAARERTAAGQEPARRFFLSHLYAAHNRLGLTPDRQALLAPVLLRLGVAVPSGTAAPSPAHAVRG